MKRRARRGAERCVCARERRGRERENERDRSRGEAKRRKGGTQKERERERETKGRENAEEGAVRGQEGMHGNEAQAGRPRFARPAFHQRQGELSGSFSSVSPEGEGGQGGEAERATGHGLTP